MRSGWIALCALHPPSPAIELYQTPRLPRPLPSLSAASCALSVPPAPPPPPPAPATATPLLLPGGGAAGHAGVYIVTGRRERLMRAAVICSSFVTGPHLGGLAGAAGRYSAGADGPPVAPPTGRRFASVQQWLTPASAQRAGRAVAQFHGGRILRQVVQNGNRGLNYYRLCRVAKASAGRSVFSVAPRRRAARAGRECRVISPAGAEVGAG